MATVKQLVEDLGQGRRSLEQVVQEFRDRAWPRDRALTPEQRAGLADLPLPSPNSFDWVDLSPHLNKEQRQALRAAHEQAHHVAL